MNALLLLPVLAPYAPPEPPAGIPPPKTARTIPLGLASSYIPSAVNRPYIVNVRDLRLKPTPPNPVKVVAPLMAYETGGARLGDAANTVIVYGLPTDIVPGSLMEVAGYYAGGVIAMQSYSAYRQTGNDFIQIDGMQPEAAPPPTAISGDGVTGTVTWKRVPIVAKATATYVDPSGAQHNWITENRCIWLTDVDNVQIEFAFPTTWRASWREKDPNPVDGRLVR